MVAGVPFLSKVLTYLERQTMWFSIPTDNGLAVCAAVVQPCLPYNPPPVKDFGKLLTLLKRLLKGNVRTARESSSGENRYLLRGMQVSLIL